MSSVNYKVLQKYKMAAFLGNATKGYSTPEEASRVHLSHLAAAPTQAWHLPMKSLSILGFFPAFHSRFLLMENFY